MKLQHAPLSPSLLYCFLCQFLSLVLQCFLIFITRVQHCPALSLFDGLYVLGRAHQLARSKRKLVVVLFFF